MNNKTEDIPKEKLKLLFSDLLRGYCNAFYSGRIVQIKHLTHFDIADFDTKYNEYFDEAIRKGAQTSEERLKYLIEEGSWSSQKDKEIKDNQLFIEGLKETKSKLFRSSEIDQINKTILEAETKIKKLEDEKLQLLQFTAETFASKKISEYQIFKSFYYNDSIIFSQEDYDQLTDKELSVIINLYNEKFVHFNERNFKRIAISNFFLNSFCLCKDNPFTFYGKPVVQLTLFQIETFSHAVFFKHILSNAPSKPPSYIMDDPDKLIDWHNSSKSMKEQVVDKGKKVDDIVGLTQKDKDLLGIQPTQNPHEKLIEAAKKKGQPLTAQEIMRIQGVL